MLEFVLVAFAAFAVWSLLRTLVTVPGRIAPLAVAGIAYGLTFVPPVALLVIAATGAVALLCYFTSDAELPEPPQLRMPKLPEHKPKTTGKTEATGQGFKPSGQVGRRVPKL